MDVRLDLYADSAAGAYALAVQARPAGLAAAEDLPGRSADLILDGVPARAGARSLTFVPAVSSPLGSAALARPGRIIYAFLYHPHDEQAMLDFDARITAEYTAFFAGRGVYYTGTYRVSGPDGPCIGEILAFDAAGRAEAERLGTEDLGPRINAIEEECRALQDRTRRRYDLWLVPR